MKLGEFETYSDGRVRVESGAEYDRCIYEGFVRALHEAYGRGEIAAVSDPSGLRSIIESRLHRDVEHFLGSVGETQGTIAERLRAVREELSELRQKFANLKGYVERRYTAPTYPLNGPSTTGDSTHAPAQWPSTAFRESL